MTRRRRFWVPSLGLLLVAGLGVWWILPPEPPTKPAPIPVRSDASSTVVDVALHTTDTYRSRDGFPKIRVDDRSLARRGSGGEPRLRFFHRYQDPDGGWAWIGHRRRCEDEGLEPEPGEPAPGADAAATALALCCFLAGNHDHKTPNKWRDTIRDGLRHLREVQRPDGSWGPTYPSSLATLALVRAYSLTEDSELRDPAQRAVDLLRSRQHRDRDDPDAPGGWSIDGGDPSRIDSFTTCWAILALRTARLADLEVGDALRSARVWLERAWRAANPDHEQLDLYEDASEFPEFFDPTTGEVEGSMPAAGALACVYLGEVPWDVMLGTLATTLMRRLHPRLDGFDVDSCQALLATLAIFQVGGDRWDEWFGTYRPFLIRSVETRGGCLAGSWDPYGLEGSRPLTDGRLAVTAYRELTLWVGPRTHPFSTYP